VALEPGTVVGGYRIEELLGRGGMGVVYSARHLELGRQVALKVIAGELGSDPEFVARFQREGQLQASLEHPHVVTVYEAGESEHGLYLAMRLVSGTTLAALMRERALGAMPALALLEQVADPLDAAHAAGLVHRDVKPQNVLVGDSDDAYLGDFGLMRVGGPAGMTATGKLVGTISYLAPEVIRGSEATPASDRYAFAAMTFECLAGSVVFPRTTDAATLYAHTTEPPPRISRRRKDLPPALDDVFARALSKDPGDRPRSASEFIGAVRDTLGASGLEVLGPPPPPGMAALEGDTVEPIPPAGRPAVGRRPSGRRLVLPLLAAAALGAVVATAVGLVVREGDDAEAGGVPAPLAGAEALGSDLREPGRALDCRGRAPGPLAPSCTIVQSGLPDRTLVVPADGVVRRWAVRSARGELFLAVLRPREGGAFQVARSPNEFVSNGGVHTFDANLAVERGDQLGLVAIAGSAVGVRTGVDGAATLRWMPRLVGIEPADRGAGTGFDHELLLRVDYVAGGRQRLPRQVTGAEAERLAPGRLVRQRRVRFTNGRPVEIRLVRLGDRYALDMLRDGKRTARVEVQGFHARGGRIIQLEVYAETEPAALGVFIEYAREDSARILNHFYATTARDFEFVN